MKLRSWLSTCSSSSTTSAATVPPKSPFSDTTSTSSDSQTLSNHSPNYNTSSSSSNSSIRSNLSLLTLPSVPSLQKLTVLLSPDQHYSTTFLTSLNPNPRAHINFLTLHHNLLYAATGNQIHVYDTTTNTLFDTFNVEKKSPTGSVKSIEFSQGKIFTAHQDCSIRVWKIINSDKNGHHKLVATLPTLPDRLTRFILPQNYVRVRRHVKKLWIQHHDAVSGLAAAVKNNSSVFSVSWDGSIKIWKNLKCVESINKAHHDAINHVVVSKDGIIIYTGSADKRIKVWKKDEEKKKKKHVLLATLEKHKSAVNALALSEDESVLFSGSCDRSILVWEREDSANYMTVTGALRGHAKAAILCLINVGDLLLSGSADRTVRIWRRGVDGRYCCLAVLDGHQKPVRSLAAVVEEDGGVRVFSGSFDGEIRVWRVQVNK